MMATPTAPWRAPVSVWWRAIRPYSYPASVVPVAAGGAAALLAGAFSVPAFLLTLLGCIALQTGSNLANEYYDWRQGADHAGSMGPAHVILPGYLAPGAVWWGAVISIVVGSVAGLLLLVYAGWPILALGLAGVVLAWGYTAPPLKLAYRALGELAVFFAFGPLMVFGAYLVHRPPADGVGPALAASLPIGLLTAAILLANNVRDLEDDHRLGKHTLATLLGHAGARREFDLLLLGPYASLPLLSLAGLLPWTVILAFASLPSAGRVRRLVLGTRDPVALRPAVRLTAQVHLRFGLLLALGMALPGLLGQISFGP